MTQATVIAVIVAGPSCVSDAVVDVDAPLSALDCCEAEADADADAGVSG